MMANIKEAASNFGKVMGSASKIVLLTFAFTICIGLFTSHVDLETFKQASTMVLTYYFAKSQISGDTNSQ